MSGHNDKIKVLRSTTMLSLTWLANRLRKARSIKDKLDKGEYDISSDEVADRILDFKK